MSNWFLFFEGLLRRDVLFYCIPLYLIRVKNGYGRRYMNIIRRFFEKERAGWAVLISAMLFLSLFISVALFESDKNVFRIQKLSIFIIVLIFIAARIYFRIKPLAVEMILAVYPVSAFISGFYNFGPAPHLAYTVDGPVLFCASFFAMVSFMRIAGKEYVSFFRRGMILIFIFSAAVMSFSSYAGFVHKLVSSAGVKKYSFVEMLVQQDNWNGFLTNPNAIASFFLMGIVANGLYFVLNRRSMTKTRVLLLHGLTVLFFVNALLTQCRGVVLSSVVFSVILIAWYYTGEYREGRLSRSRFYFSGGIILLSLAALFLLELRFGIVSTLLEKTLSSKSSFRIEFWQVFLDKNLFHPQIKSLIGYGYQPSTHHYNTVNPYYGMHNFVFEIWARYGFAAIICILSVLSFLFVNYIRRFGVDSYILAVCAILMHNLFEDYIFFHIHLITTMFFIYLLSCLAVRISLSGKSDT